MKTENLSLKCLCGSFKAVAREVAPSRGTHVICLCDDCQTYAHALGRAKETLDHNGGTEIFQLTPSQLTITEGHQHLACLRLSERGLMRWFASCCNTPFANTLPNPKIPFAGMPVLMALTAGNKSPQVFGPVLGRIHSKYAVGKVTEKISGKVPLLLILRTLRVMLMGKLRSHNKPNPFFDRESGEPAAIPRVLSLDERNRFRKLAGPR